MIEALWLVRNGIPYDVATSLPDEERIAYSVIFGTFEGGDFDWEALRFRQKK